MSVHLTPTRSNHLLQHLIITKTQSGSLEEYQEYVSRDLVLHTGDYHRVEGNSEGHIKSSMFGCIPYWGQGYPLSNNIRHG